VAEPPITIRAAHDSGPGNAGPTRVVIHATCPDVGYPDASAAGMALSTARYFTKAEARGSAHYVADPVDEQHCVPDNVVAWHAPPNPHSLGIEICAEGGDYQKNYTRAQWLSAAVWPAVARAAARTAELCARHGIPVVRIGPAALRGGAAGICGHVDVAVAWGQSSHTDPGGEFPWPEFMAAVLGGGAVSPTPNTTTDLEELVTAYDWPAGQTTRKIVCPEGKARRFSMAADGHFLSWDVWFQAATSGLSEVHSTGPNGDQLRLSWVCPPGTSQITVHYTATGPVGACLELNP